MAFSLPFGKKLQLKSFFGNSCRTYAISSPTSSLQFTPFRVGLLLSFLIIVAYPGIVLGTHSFFYRDFGLFGYPLAHYHREAFWRGEIPLWNPLNNCGIPFLAQWNTMVVYPFSLIYLLLPEPWGLNLFCLAHWVLGGIAMYHLASFWTKNSFAASVAAVLYSCNGLTLHCLMWPNNIAALAWMPLVILWSQRACATAGRSCVIAALIAAIQMLAGAPEITLFTWLIVVALACRSFMRKEVPFTQLAMRLMLLVTLVFSLAAAQLLPFLDLLAHSQRNNHFGGTAWTLPPWGLANFFVPLFHESASLLNVFSQDEQQWTSSYYMGLAASGLALFALFQNKNRGARFWGGFLLAGVLLAFGQNGFVLPALQKLLPFVGALRFPIKFIVLTVFAVPLLVALSIDSAQKLDPVKFRKALVAMVALVLLAVLLILLVAIRYPFPGDSFDITMQSALKSAGWLVAISALIYFYNRQPKPNSRLLYGWILLVLFACDVFTHAPRQNPTVPASVMHNHSNESLPVTDFGQGRLMLAPTFKRFLDNASTADPAETYKGFRQARFANCNLLEASAKLDGFYSLYLKEESELREQFEKLHDSSSLPLARFLGVTQISDPNTLFAWAQHFNAMPLITGGQLPVYLDHSRDLTSLLTQNFDPATTLLLSPGSPTQVTNAAKVRVLNATAYPEAIHARIEASAGCWVTIAQTFYHPWQAYVDDKPQELYRANHAFQALQLGRGIHEVRLVYRDWWFFSGCIISATAMLACLIVWAKLKNITPHVHPQGENA